MEMEATGNWIIVDDDGALLCVQQQTPVIHCKNDDRSVIVMDRVKVEDVWRKTKTKLGRENKGNKLKIDTGCVISLLVLLTRC